MEQEVADRIARHQRVVSPRASHFKFQACAQIARVMVLQVNGPDSWMALPRIVSQLKNGEVLR